MPRPPVRASIRPHVPTLYQLGSAAVVVALAISRTGVDWAWAPWAILGGLAVLRVVAWAVTGR